MPRLIVAGTLLFALIVAITGLTWGLPYIWHPDEKTELAAGMLEDRTFDPDYFINPSLHIYTVGAAVWIAQKFVPGKPEWGTPWIVPMTEPNHPHRRAQFAVNLAARAVSVLFSIGGVWWLWRSTRKFLGEWPAALATAASGTSLGVMNFAHFATPDACLVFWTVGALAMFAKVGRSAGMRDASLAGVCFGLACSTKYYGILLVAPLVWSLVPIFRERGFSRASVLGLTAGVCGVAAFFVATPYALIHWSTFVRDGLLFTWRTGAPTDSLVHVVQRSWGHYGGHLANALSPPIFTLAVVSAIVWAVRPSRDRETQRVLGIHAVWIAVFWGFLGLSPHNAMRFIMPVVPSLAIFAGWGAARLFSLRPGWPRRFAVVATSVLFLYSAAYTATGAYWIANDTRYTAGAWLKRHVLRESGVCYFALESYLPFFDRPKYQVTFRSEVYPNRTRAEEFDAWRRDTFAAINEVVVDSSLFYTRFYDEPDKWPGRVGMYRELFDGTDPAGYRLVASFEQGGPRWLRPEVELVSPRVVVFAKPGQLRN